MSGHRCFVPFLIINLSLSAYNSTYYGRIVDNGSPARPIANATVWVQSASSCSYTDSLGNFNLTFTSIKSPKRNDHYHNAGFRNGKIAFSCSREQVMRLDLYALSGRKAVTLMKQSFKAGTYEFTLQALIPRNVVPGLYIVAAETGDSRHTAALLLTNSSTSTAGAGIGCAVSRGSSGLAKTGTVSDNLAVYKMGYERIARPLSDTTSYLGDIVLSRTAREAAIERRADSILALMTIDEKAGQMVQAQINFTDAYPDRLTNGKIASMAVGSVFNGGSDESAAGQPNTPDAWAAAIDRIQKTVLDSSRLKIPIIYGQDCVHGAAEISGCTVFPHNIGLGCTGDTALVAKVGRITAAECTGIGVRFNFWPCIAAVRNERWGRTYEGFGETPEINSLMGAAYIRGLQGDGDMGKVGAVAACAKHYLGDGGTNDGVNNGEVTISEATMRSVHLPPYAAAARELVATVMPSYHTWLHDGCSWKQTLDRRALTSILKTELGFDGFCVSDWDAVARACSSYKVDCVAQAVNAGLDMAMIIGEWNCGEFINSIKEGVINQTIPISRIDDAVRRILRVKLRFGLFDHPYSDPALRSRIGSTESRAVARECVRKSMVLLKNEGDVLPLQKAERVAVVGAWANSLGAQCGGWTITWQGSAALTGIAGQTILQGLQEKGSNVFFSEFGDDVANADKIVVVVGENPYAEQYGDCSVPDLSECPNASLIEKCFNSGKPVILVMVTGRPMIIDTEINWCKAVVAAWLPGGEGGGIADVLFGDCNFSGTLTHTWPASAAQIPINAGPDYADEQKGCGGEPLYPYGFGLRYSR
ncbi:MAG: glycoside hydrolase family 3 C-terminal domain-containing protein [Chitinispirillaceae bacterium]|nr:glycoside hydrolase family 3 C-terminal domain-containing protein [Chitinispirillaceae bacterium]